MPGKPEIRQDIGSSKLFRDISPEALEQIADISRVQVVAPNTFVHQHGDPLTGCSIISSGRVRISAKGKKGARYDLVSLGPGESFAELALLTQGPAPSAVETLEETTLIIIPRDGIAPILRDHPEVIQAVGKRISQVIYGVGSALESAVENKISTPRLSVVDFVFILGLSVFLAIGFNHANPKGLPMVPKIELDEAISFVNAAKAFEAYQTRQTQFVDAMPSGFYEKEHIPGAQNLPLSMFDFMYDMFPSHKEKDKKIIVYGRTISRYYDEEVANKLVIRGHRNVEILEGGLQAWKKNGHPVEP
jgi:rhodanese-related sulfurtransferase